MNCLDIVAMLDGHAFARSNAAQRRAVNSHLAACESCSDHWQAQQALEMQGVPRVRPELLAETRRLVAAQSGSLVAKDRGAEAGLSPRQLQAQPAERNPPRHPSRAVPPSPPIGLQHPGNSAAQVSTR